MGTCSFEEYTKSSFSFKYNIDSRKSYSLYLHTEVTTNNATIPSEIYHDNLDFIKSIKNIKLNGVSIGSIDIKWEKYENGSIENGFIMNKVVVKNESIITYEMPDNYFYINDKRSLYLQTGTFCFPGLNNCPKYSPLDTKNSPDYSTVGACWKIIN